MSRFFDTKMKTYRGGRFPGHRPDSMCGPVRVPSLLLDMVFLISVAKINPYALQSLKLGEEASEGLVSIALALEKTRKGRTVSSRSRSYLLPLQNTVLPNSLQSEQIKLDEHT